MYKAVIPPIHLSCSLFRNSWIFPRYFRPPSTEIPCCKPTYCSFLYYGTFASPLQPFHDTMSASRKHHYSDNSLLANWFPVETDYTHFLFSALFPKGQYFLQQSKTQHLPAATNLGKLYHTSIRYHDSYRSVRQEQKARKSPLSEHHLLEIPVFPEIVIKQKMLFFLSTHNLLHRSDHIQAKQVGQLTQNDSRYFVPTYSSYHPD